MKNFFFLAVLLLCFTPGFLSAQDGAPRKHQLSFNLLALRQNQQVDFLYQGYAEKGSLRFGLNGNFYSRQSDHDNSLLDRADYYYNIGLRGGWAFHEMVQEFDLYYGADAVLRYRFDQRTQNQQASDANFFVDNRSITRLMQPGLAIEPFLGLSYAINEIFSLGLELRSSLGYTLGINQESRERTMINLNSNEVQIETSETGPIQIHNFQMSLINFYGVWFSIHL